MFHNFHSVIFGELYYLIKIIYGRHTNIKTHILVFQGNRKWGLWYCDILDTGEEMLSSYVNVWFDLIWLHRYYLNWTELDDAITEINNEMPSTENVVFNLVILHYWHTIYLFWYCAVALTQFVLLKVNKGDVTWLHFMLLWTKVYYTHITGRFFNWDKISWMKNISIDVWFVSLGQYLAEI